jgi:hypothetical protein
MSTRPSAWATGGHAFIGNEPRFSFSAENDGYSVTVPNVTGMNDRRPLPIGTLITLDWLGFEFGFVSFQPKFDDRFMAYFGRPVPTPPDPSVYVEALRIPVYVENEGLLRWLVTSKIVLNATRAWYEEFGYHDEAQQLRLPVLQTCESKTLEIAGRPEVYYRPMAEIVGWIERTQEQFGPVRVAPPPPLLTAAAPPIALPPAPANDERATYRPIVTPAPAPAPREAPKPANDLLASFRKRNF